MNTWDKKRKFRDPVNIAVEIVYSAIHGQVGRISRIPVGPGRKILRLGIVSKLSVKKIFKHIRIAQIVAPDT